MTDTRSRLLKIAAMLYAGHEITSRFIADNFGVSNATARRDVTVLEQALPVRCRRSDRNGQLHYDYERVLYMPRELRA